MGSRIVHTCISVRGVLNWPRAEFRRALKWITRDDGTPFRTVDELRDFFLDELQRGRSVLPLTTPPCEGFDYQTGCPGHPVEDEAEVAHG